MTISDILNKFSEKIEAESSVKVVLANIATANDDDTGFDKSNILFSVVNIEEDKTLKNQSLFKKEVVKVITDDGEIDSKEKYKRPAQNLVFSILFTSYIKSSEQYVDGLSKLEQVIRYLQNNNVFYFDSNKLYEQTDGNLPNDIESNKLIIDMVSLKPDQLNQMWSYLGSKYMPSVLYTMRLVRIQNENVNTRPVIKEFKTQLWENDKDNVAGELESKEF